MRSVSRSRKAFQGAPRDTHRPPTPEVHLDLTQALARHAELVGELIERDRLVGKPPRLEDAALHLMSLRRTAWASELSESPIKAKICLT
jgi:hypothetical protein